MRRRPRLLTAAATVALLTVPLLLQAGPAQSAGLTYGYQPHTGPPGTLIRFHGSGCAPNDAGPDGTDGVFLFVVRPLGSVAGQRQKAFQSRGDGGFAGRIKVRAGQRPGRYPTGVVCFGRGKTAGWPDDPTRRFRVSAASTG